MNYIDIEAELITGVMAGFEIITDPEVLVDGDQWVAIIDLFIIRIMIFRGVR